MRRLMIARLGARGCHSTPLAFRRCEPRVVGAWQFPVIVVELLRRWATRNDKCLTGYQGPLPLQGGKFR